MNELTKAEEQVMQYLWKLEKAFVKEIISQMDEPKPAYNTVSTIIRILEEKGVVGHEAFGKSHRYFPLITKEEYGKFTAGKMLDKYFNSSVKDLVSFFVKEKQMDMQDLDEILKSIESKKNKS